MVMDITKYILYVCVLTQQWQTSQGSEVLVDGTKLKSLYFLPPTTHQVTD